MKTRVLMMTIPWLMASACGSPDASDSRDPVDECVFCDSKSDAFGIARDSYLAYGVVAVANTASLHELDDDVPLDARAARGIVAQRPFEYIEQIDTVPYVGRTAFENLARYAQDNGFVPFCGDGGVQPILESCDDGNSIDGDGCSSQCVVEGNATVHLADQPELIQGSHIGAPMVDPNAFYMRERRISAHPFPADVAALLQRADGIIANQAANDRVSFDELAILSTSPFCDSLLSAERRALTKAWQFFEVSSAPVVDIDAALPDFTKTIGVETEITRPGPLVLRPRPIPEIAWYDSNDELLLRRLQQMPGLNLDNNASTIELHDIDKALEDYEQVFTADELNTLRSFRPDFFKGLTEIESEGDFVITYDFVPHLAEQTGQMAAFDGYEFRWRARHHLTYRSDDAFDDITLADEFDVNLYGDWRFYPELLIDGSQSRCVYNECNLPFFHADVAYRTLADAPLGRRLRGLVLLERWEGNKRVYNRVLNFARDFQQDYTPQYLDPYAGARPMLADGTYLSVKKFHDQNGYDYFELYPVATPFNRQLKKLLPKSGHLLDQLEPGRYEPFEGVVLDVHSSRAMVAYINGCEVPLAATENSFSGTCDRIDVKVWFSRGQARLAVRPWGQTNRTVDIGGDAPDALRLDTSYYVVRH